MNRPIGDKSIITIFDQVLKDTIGFTNVYCKGKNSKGKDIMGRHYSLRSWRGSLITYLAAMGMSTRHIQLFSLHSSHSVIDYYVEKLELLKLKQGLMDQIEQNLQDTYSVADTATTVASNSATYTCTQQQQTQSNVEHGASIDAEYGDAYARNDHYRFNDEHGDEFGDNDEYHDNYQDTLNSEYGVNDEHYEVPEAINFEQGVCNDYIDDATDIYMDQNECNVYSRNSNGAHSLCVNGTVDDETMISLGRGSKGIDIYIFQIANSFRLLHIQD